MAGDLRWGILGTGGIAQSFVGDLRLLADATVTAVGSRSVESAERFGKRLGVARRHGSYRQLVQDPEVDVVYVATPHPMHAENAMLAIAAGKHVLIEKPFTMNAQEAREVVGAARDAGVFVMEAMWTRFLPHMKRVRALLDEGSLGDVRTVLADHGQWFPFDPAHRLLAPELGGGALLDLGVYPISFASMVLGTPEKVTAVSNPAATGVDAQTSAIFQYAGGQHAVVTTTLAARSPTRAAIVGTEARIEIDGRWYGPTSFCVIARDGEVRETYNEPHEGKGLRQQAAEVARCVREGVLESPTMPPAETVSIMETMDEVRRQIGLSYPARD